MIKNFAFKKPLKIMLVILVIILVATVSCKNNNGTEVSPGPASTPTPTQGPPGIVEISTNSVFFYDGTEFFYYNYYNDSQKWISLIEDNYNIDLRVNSIYEQTQALYQGADYAFNEIQFLTTGIQNDLVSGLYYLSFNENLLKLYESGFILPLDEYLTENKQWDTLPEGWRTAYNIDGVTLAIPSVEMDVIRFRFIRQDWLENISMDAPTTIDEFYEVLKGFTYNDPDKNESFDTKGAISKGLWGMQDIFASFDARANHRGEMSPTWNPNTNIWEDSMLKPEMAECIDFLRMCRNEKIIEDTVQIDRKNQFERGLVGSYYTSGIPSIFESYIKDTLPAIKGISVTTLSGLSHNISQNIIGYHTEYSNPIVMLNNSEDPKATLNGFLDTFIFDKEGYILNRYGLPESSGDDSYFRESGDTIIYKGIQYEDSYYPMMTPSLVVGNPLFEITSYQEPENPLFTEYDKNFNAAYDRAISSSTYYKIPWFAVNPAYSSDIAKGLADAKNMAHNIIIHIIEGDMQFEEGLQQYQNFARIINMQDFLDTQNEQLGKTTNQTY